jgi:hypothetical protein
MGKTEMKKTELEALKREALGKKEESDGNQEKATVDKIDIEIKDVQKAHITKIEKGVLKDFIPEDKIKNKDKVDTETYKIYFETELGGKGSFLLTKSIHKNSNMRKYLVKYGKAPYLGQEITVSEDGKGFLRPIF